MIMQKGTCLQTYIPMRSEPRSGAEMVSTLLFGESYDVLNEQDDWLRIRTEFDNYDGWISASSFHEYIQFTEMIDTDYVEAYTKGEKLQIPCGGLIPENNKIQIGDKSFELKLNLKPNHHLPFRIRLVNTARSLLNAPYLWGGRSFMGIDCSGFVQVVFKANGINLPRDTRQQIKTGNPIHFKELEAGDLVFFTKPDKDTVSHVGLMISPNEIIHASGKVRIDKLTQKGIVSENDVTYKILDIRRVMN